MDVLMCLIICLLYDKKLASFVRHDEIVYNLRTKIYVNVVQEKYTVSAIKLVLVFFQNVSKKIQGSTSLFWLYQPVLDCTVCYWRFNRYNKKN